MSRRRIVIALLLVHAILVGWIGIRKSPIVDEFPHLVAGISHWEFGTFELYRVNPPLVRMVAAVPVLAYGVRTDWGEGWSDHPAERPEFPLGHRLIEANAEHCFWLCTLARWACLPFSLLGAIVCYCWGRDLYGGNAGIVALVLWCFDPNILAWSATICPDVPAASFGLLAGYAYWCWLLRPSWDRAMLAGVALGAALLTKSTWLVLLGIWPALWLIGRFMTNSGRRADGFRDEQTGRPRQSRAGLFVIVLVGIYVLNAGYGFSGSLRFLGDFHFISRVLAGNQPPREVGNRFRGTCLEEVPVPLPAAFVIGVDVQRYEFEQGKWSYLRGEHKFGGWWWYYLYALGVKTPLATWGLFVLALATRHWLNSSQSGLWDELCLLAMPLVVLVIISSQTGFNRYLRYVLPAVPFVFVWISRLALLFEPSPLRQSPLCRAGRVIVLVCFAGLIWSSLGVWPHSMSYFNLLAGGPENGHRHLLDANIDWGQDLLELRRWVERRSLRDRLFVSYSGWVDPEFAGIEANDIPSLLLNNRGQVIEGHLDDIQPGWYAVGVNQLMGYREYNTDRPSRCWLREFTCVDRAGYSIWIFHLTPEDVQSFRQRHHLHE